MLKKNLFRIVLSCALTLSYIWTACQRQEEKKEVSSSSHAAQAEETEAKTTSP